MLTTADGPASPKTSTVEYRNIIDVHPSPENDDLYQPVSDDDEEFVSLIESVKADGILDPIIITEDGYILSGHRRRAAAMRAGLDVVPVRIQRGVRWDETPTDEFRRLLAEFNVSQRRKTAGERLRERLAITEPNRHQQIVAARLEGLQPTKNVITTNGAIRRSSIGVDRRQFLDAVLGILKSCKEYLPVSARHIHYQLATRQAIRNSRTGTVYENDNASSRALSRLLTEARVSGDIPMDWIVDETRPETVWQTCTGVDQFVRRQFDAMRAAYWLDLMADQPAHIEIVCEKLTLKSQVEKVAMEYTIPSTIARGKCSIPPRHHVFERWKASGKKSLTIIILADWDPDGLVIADMWHKSLIGDFNVPPESLTCIRAGVNPDHAGELDLPRSIEAKPSSPTYKKFVAEHGCDVFELDAVPMPELHRILREAIESVVDRDAYERQVELEKRQAQALDAVVTELTKEAADLLDQGEWH